MPKIIKRPQLTADTFLQAAPDDASHIGATTTDPTPKRERKVKITHTIPEDMLARLDDKAAQLGQSRAALINLSIAKLLEA